MSQQYYTTATPYVTPDTTQQAPQDYAYNYAPQYVDYRQTATATYPQVATAPLGGWVNFSDTSYVKGFVVGAGVALVVANPTVQKLMVSGAVKLWSAVQGGVEEVKEQIKDIKAEISQDD